MRSGPAKVKGNRGSGAIAQTNPVVLITLERARMGTKIGRDFGGKCAGIGAGNGRGAGGIVPEFGPGIGAGRAGRERFWLTCKARSTMLPGVLTGPETNTNP